MKRSAWLPLLLLSVSLWVAPAAAQDDAARAAAMAERQEQEERARRLEANLSDVLAAQQEQQKRIAEQARQIDDLREEVRRLRDDLLKAGAAAVTREDLKKIVEKVSEIDKRRVDDNKLLREAIENLGTKLLTPPPAPAPAPPARKDEPSGAETAELGYWHVVESGQYLSTIVQAFRDQGVKVTVKQVMDANPKVDWNRLPVGKKIFIPDPSKAKPEEKTKPDSKP